MTNTVLLKRSATANSAPSAGSLLYGELAINYADGNLYYLNSANAVTVIASNKTVSLSGNVTAGNILTGGLISATGNITGKYFLGNANIQYTASTAPTTGNLIGAQWYNTSTDALYEWQTDGTSSYWVDITGPVVGVTGGATGNVIVNGTSNVTIPSANGNAGINIGGTANVAIFATTGAYITGVISATGNITGGNLNATGLSLSGNVVSAINTTANITTTANISGGNILGTHVGNVTGATASLSGNITGGNLLTGGLISATGNLTVGNITTTIANVTTFNSAQGGNVTGTLVATSANAQFINQTNGAGYATVAGYLSVAGNVTGGNILTVGLISATGSINSDGNIIAGTNTKAGPALHYTNSANSQYGALLMQKAGVERWLIGSDNSTANGNIVIRFNATTNYVTVTETGNVSMTGNVTGGNILTGGVVSATGNITATANITGGNILTAGVMSSTGNAIHGNISTAGLITVTGNITGGNLTTTGAVYSNYNTNTANTASFNATGGNTKGGTGYLDFLVAQNTSGGATNPYKWFRTSSTGALEIINSAYSATILSLSDTGGLSVPGPISISGKQAVNGPAFSAYANATLQTITSGSQQKVLFQTEEFDTNSNYANSRFTPTVEGYYQLNAEVRLDGASGTGEMMIVIWKNGSGYKRGTNQSGTQIAANFWAMQVSSVVYANGTTDYFEIYVQQGSGGSLSVTAVNDPAITWFNGCMLRGA